MDFPLRHFQKSILSWFEHNKRRFPWRNTTDPYEILIAEKLLQQTHARQTVVEIYKILLAKYPNIDALSRADLRTLRPLVAPLGLVYRARELKKLGQTIVERHGGRIPDNYDELLSLPGLGQYASRAILCFAFGRPISVVDTNVSRFLYRVFGLPGNQPSNPARSKELISLSQELIPSRKAREFNLGILDLCAEICTPKEPNCSECPVNIYCKFNLDQETGQS